MSFPNSYVESDDVRRWGLWEVIRSRGWRLYEWARRPERERERERASPRVPSIMCGHSKKALCTSQIVGSPDNESALIVYLPAS